MYERNVEAVTDEDEDEGVEEFDLRIRDDGHDDDEDGGEEDEDGNRKRNLQVKEIQNRGMWNIGLFRSNAPDIDWTELTMHPILIERNHHAPDIDWTELTMHPILIERN